MTHSHIDKLVAFLCKSNRISGTSHRKRKETRKETLHGFTSSMTCLYVDWKTGHGILGHKGNNHVFLNPNSSDYALNPSTYIKKNILWGVRFWIYTPRVSLTSKTHGTWPCPSQERGSLVQVRCFSMMIRQASQANILGDNVPKAPWWQVIRDDAYKPPWIHSR